MQTSSKVRKQAWKRAAAAGAGWEYLLSPSAFAYRPLCHAPCQLSCPGATQICLAISHSDCHPICLLLLISGWAVCRGTQWQVRGTRKPGDPSATTPAGPSEPLLARWAPGQHEPQALKLLCTRTTCRACAPRWAPPTESVSRIRICISHKFPDGAGPGPHFEKHCSRSCYLPTRF